MMAARAHEVDWESVYAGRIRAIEDVYDTVHRELLEWGRWGRERFPGRPRLMLSGIWTLPGETDPDRDPEAVPESKQAPIDERAVLILDARINATDFPAVWAKVLQVSYVRRLPEYQRPDDAHMGAENFIEQLSNALEYLRT